MENDNKLTKKEKISNIYIYIYIYIFNFQLKYFIIFFSTKKDII